MNAMCRREEALFPKNYVLQKTIASPSVRFHVLGGKEERQGLLEFPKCCWNKPHPQRSEENTRCSSCSFNSLDFLSSSHWRQFTLGISESERDYVLIDGLGSNSLLFVTLLPATSVSFPHNITPSQEEEALVLPVLPSEVHLPHLLTWLF